MNLNIKAYKCVIMPRKEINDYTFYKIININRDIQMCYVGSTVNMKERVRSHKKNCNCPTNPKYNRKVYQKIREHGGWDEFKMIEIGTAEQLTLTEAHIIEERYRVELCAELNMIRCYVTEEERKELGKVECRNRYENNKEVYNEKNKVYRENNKDKIKTLLRTKITCECGCVICHGEKSRHRKTKKHIDLMNNKNNI